jgi:replicative DNA helicase
MRIEHAILKHLIYDEDYTRKVLPFIKSEYFSDRTEKTIYEQIKDFVGEYNTNPTYESLIIQLNENNLSEEEYTQSIEVLNYVNKNG